MKRHRHAGSLLAALLLGALLPLSANSQLPEDRPAKPKEAPLPEGAIARLPAGPPIAFSPDGKLLVAGPVSATDVHSLSLWDVATRKPVRKFVGPKKPGLLFGTFVNFTAAAFSGDGKILATGSSDGSLRLWDVATGKEIREWPGHRDFVLALDLTADGKTLVSHGWNTLDGNVKVWDADTGKERHNLPEKGNMSKIPCLSPSGKMVAVLNDKNYEVTVYDAASGEKKNSFPVDRGGNQVALIYHPGGNSLFVTSFGDRGAIRRYDAATGKELVVVAKQRDIRSVSFSKDFSVVAALTQEDKSVNVWDVASGKLRGKLTADTKLWTVAVAPDGKLLATQGEAPGGVLLWEMPE
jgi:WD40 repeat protein